MPIIGQEYKGCRYWGFEPASAGEARTGTKTREEKREARERNARERATLKIAGYKSSIMGLNRAQAIQQAEALESRFPDIKFTVFNHDYL